MTKWKYANPRHDCPALGKDVIIPKSAHMVNGELKPWGFKCPFCSMGRPFTDKEKELYLEELMEEAEDESDTTTSGEDEV